MYFGKGSWKSFEQGAEKEWLVANGLGGYAAGTVIGANASKYHGLLVAALNPPVERVVLLAKLDEQVEAGGITYNLASNQTNGEVTHFGYVHLQRVIIDPLPCFIYSFSDITMEKHVFMLRDQNTTVILYRFYNGALPATLRFTPLVNCRDFHHNTYYGQLNFNSQPLKRGVAVSAVSGVPPLKIISSAGRFNKRDDWYKGMYYARERERGLNPYEDHFMPGYFEVKIDSGEVKTITVVATIEEKFPADQIAANGEGYLLQEKVRLEQLQAQAGYSEPLARQLVWAADSFIVHRRSTGTKSVIAGYPWFNDWGRDTMIALPGLTLITRRFEDAREILSTFARYCKDGLLPNMFADGDREPLYNTVDASLWYFQAVYKFLEYTGDFDFIRSEIFPVLRDIIYCHVRGTHFNIKADEDGLLQAGSPSLQLTWMDAKVNDWVVTPRHGKPVEINALWYNALCVYEKLCRHYGEIFPYGDLPGKVENSFIKQFWYSDAGILYDVIGPDGKKDAKLRPNQIIAVSLPHSMLSKNKSMIILRRVWQELYATYGLRSLSLRDPEYKGVYTGDQLCRDGAYHQGTVWGWLIGPFISAYRRINAYSPASREQAERFIAPFIDHLRDHGVGFISEIFDGNEPVKPRGTFAQAWSVAEVLRAYVEDVLEIKPGRG
ncbi:glycogen debranching enzyme [Desulfofarcimen acetoxidans DSM 771]|uniref:Glycogen debranching enzyme n=1 Tax=Desulfofarcimen acetoxidans (strain ATCC 49208 / DSM 771 / KCTC 5769 / VKM B-1644 / 5575) TaxID=485916 RepID=C8VY08_DESAS|nr:amylo-alpha-1,6-glucosidase [Desulfofarcimen acetoxidans]ACV64637.1 glycogen debranching enzyme [Desulfofarcimen acetoxidans DSM 771]